MVDFKSNDTFADPDDSKLVADAKRDIAPPTEYSYTEASTTNNVGLGALFTSAARCNALQSRNRSN